GDRAGRVGRRCAEPGQLRGDDTPLRGEPVPDPGPVRRGARPRAVQQHERDAVTLTARPDLRGALADREVAALHHVRHSTTTGGRRHSKTRATAVWLATATSRPSRVHTRAPPWT